MDRRSEARAVVRNAIEVDHRNLPDPFLQHRDLRVDDPLPLLGRLVLGVLAQIAQLAGALDLPGQLQMQLPLECGDLITETLYDAIFHSRFRL